MTFMPNFYPFMIIVERESGRHNVYSHPNWSSPKHLVNLDPHDMSLL